MDRKSELARNLEQVEAKISAALQSAGRNRSEVTLIVVSKNFPVSDIEILHELGVREFGENRDQEARTKIAALSQVEDRDFSDIRWHYQGQLQSNKLASIASWASMVHSVDKVRDLRGLSAGAVKVGRTTQCLVQLSLEPKVADHRSEASSGRAGTDFAGAIEILDTFYRELPQLSGISLVGAMAVAPLGQDPQEAFELLQRHFRELSARYPGFLLLSAGMSGDYEAALLAGATHLRIGSSILVSRT